MTLRKEVTNNGHTSAITGTGSFVVHKDVPYIVTAGHIAKVMDAKSYIIIKGHNGLPIQVNIVDLISEPAPKWQLHSKADIAILKLNPKKEILDKKYLDGRFLPSFNFYDTLKAVSRATQLTIVGFPLGLGADGFFSPLTYILIPRVV